MNLRTKIQPLKQKFINFKAKFTNLKENSAKTRFAMELLQLLKERELKATPQRLCVLRILKKHEHPNIDELYEQVRAEYPSISLATVYKNLSTLREQGLVVEVNVPNRKTYYDIYEVPHIHIVCSSCGHIMDFDFDNADLGKYQDELQAKLGNSIEKLSVVAYTSRCERCEGAKARANR